MLVTELPDDVLYGVFPHLTASDFLNFTSCSKRLLLHQDYPAFWHTLTRKTFRVPPQPLLRQARWKSLYKKLHTQTKLFTWGNNSSYNLGRPTSLGLSVGGRRSPSSGWPTEVRLDDLDVGVIADVQCGGWCTTILSSLGNVFIFGYPEYPERTVEGMPTLVQPRQLKFPPAYPPTTKHRYEPSTAIQQISTGRSIVLGLSDDGKVWSWTSDVASMIKPLHVDLREHKVERVVAGWTRGSMYIQDVGIVYWTQERESEFVTGGRQVNLAVADALLIDTVTIPGTAFRQTAGSRLLPDSLDVRIGEVVNYIILEHYVVFTTHLNKVFSYPNAYPMPGVDFTEPVELTTFLDVRNPSSQIVDIQGAFRRFAVFTNDNQIWTADRILLDASHNVEDSPWHFELNPTFPILLKQDPKRARIISIAYGDRHTHALHENGTLTSWGMQSQACGALGLGDEGREVIRGVMTNANRDAWITLAQAKTVWFEPLMERWLGDVCAHTRRHGYPEHIHGRSTVDLLGEYYEKEGAKWEANVPKEDIDVTDVGAYFVLKVAAGGWSSAALVLVDDEKAQLARNRHVLKPSAPPSDTDSLAGEYEYGDSPFDMVEIALRSVTNWVWNSGRYFLGLSQRDTRGGTETGAQANYADLEDRICYSWTRNPVPMDDIIAAAAAQNSEV